MQVDNEIEVLKFQCFNGIREGFIKQVDPIDVWIGLNQIEIPFFGQVMNFSIRKLIFQAADNGRSKHNVANGTKTDDKEFRLQN